MMGMALAGVAIGVGESIAMARFSVYLAVTPASAVVAMNRRREIFCLIWFPTFLQI